MSIKIEGFDELWNQLKAMERQVPQRGVTRAARKAATPVKQQAKIFAPLDEGWLRKGIIAIPERSRIRGKKVYQIVMDRRLNDIFVTPSDDGTRYYYPASQEYGFRTRSEGGGLSYVPGYHFLHRANQAVKHKSEQIIVDTLLDEIKKITR